MGGSYIQPVIDVFLQGDNRRKKISNTECRNNELYLFGNKIAWIDNSNLWIRDCGWCTVTTQDRLNRLPGVWLRRTKGDWYLSPNGRPLQDIRDYILWDGGSRIIN